MDSQFDAGDQVSYADKGEVWEGAVRSVGDGGVVCISGNDDDDDDDDDEYFAHSTNVVKRVPGHAEDLAPINQLPRGSVKEGDVFCLSANVANVYDARHWNSTAVVVSVSSSLIFVTDPSMITGNGDNQQFNWTVTMFYNRARIFVPFDLGFGTGENSPGTLLSTCLNMISNCVQYGGPYRYPASENATAAFVLLELTGCRRECRREFRDCVRYHH